MQQILSQIIRSDLLLVFRERRGDRINVLQLRSTCQEQFVLPRSTAREVRKLIRQNFPAGHVPFPVGEDVFRRWKLLHADGTEAQGFDMLQGLLTGQFSFGIGELIEPGEKTFFGPFSQGESLE